MIVVLCGLIHDGSSHGLVLVFGLIFICKHCCLRRNVVGDGLELDSGGAEVSELSSWRNCGAIGQECHVDIRAKKQCT